MENLIDSPGFSVWTEVERIDHVCSPDGRYLVRRI